MHTAFDWHIHTRGSWTGIPYKTLHQIAEDAHTAGLSAIGFTDHLRTRPSIGVLEASRNEYDCLAAPIPCFFGAEVSAVRQWDIEHRDGQEDFAYTYAEGPEEDPVIILDDEMKKRLSFDYAIGAAHFRLGAPLEAQAMIESFHRQQMMLAQHPFVDVIGHPWYQNVRWKNDDGSMWIAPWIDDFASIPEKYHREFAEAVVRGGKAIEINANLFLPSNYYNDRFRGQYRIFFRNLRDCGAQFAIGTDAHDAGYVSRLHLIEHELEGLGLTEDNFWRPDCMSG